MSIVPDEDHKAQLACRNNRFRGAVCAGVYPLGVVPCPDSARRSELAPRPTDSHGEFVGDGAAPESALSALSSRPQSRALVEPGTQSATVAGLDSGLRSAGAAYVGPRRSRGTAARPEHRCQRDLSRPGSFQSQPFCQSQRAAGGEGDGVGPDSVGGVDMGVALADGGGALGTVSAEEQAST